MLDGSAPQPYAQRHSASKKVFLTKSHYMSAIQ